MSGAPPIGSFELLLASAFLLVSGGLSLALKLGMVRSLAVAGARAYLQLLLLGWLLRRIFDAAHPLVVLAVLGVMVAMAVHTLLGRLHRCPPRMQGHAGLALLVSGGCVTFAVTGIVLRTEPWYAPQVVIPIAGMILGNSMNGIALCLDRLFGDLAARRRQVETALALGAEPWEAVRPGARDALRAGLIPTLNSMSAAGIVFIPGMMTGQVLSGTDPGVAAAYQIVVLLMISAATALGSVLAIYTGYRRAFSADQRLVWPPPHS